MSQAAANFILDKIMKKNSMLFCPATGSTPKRTYEILARSNQKFNDVQLLALDEWNLDRDNPASCYYYLAKTIIEPLGINRTFVFDISKNEEEIINESKDYLNTNGPIDLCILGIGQNGHLGFNEPGLTLEPHVHKIRLSEESKNHPMVAGISEKPTFGYTLGMSDILGAQKILLLVNGNHKREIMKNLMKQKISTALPASFLWLHPDVTCFSTDDVWD